LIYGLIGMIPALIVRDGKELSVRQTIIREVIQMVLTVVILLAFIFGGNPVTDDLIVTAVCVAASVVVIYIGVVAIGWFLDKKTADQLNEELIRFREKQQGQ